MARNFDDVERILDQHARRLAQGLGSLLVDLGEAIRRQAETFEPAETASRARTADPADSQPAPATRNDLLDEAARLGVRGRSRMSKADLERAIRDHRSASAGT